MGFRDAREETTIRDEPKGEHERFISQYSTPNFSAYVADHCDNCLVSAHAESRGAESHRVSIRGHRQHLAWSSPAAAFGEVETQ